MTERLSIVGGLLDRLGVTRPVAFGLAARAWNLLAGPITVWIIAGHLSPEAQGFYYTFNGLMALQVFTELGLSTVVTQFASHEWAHLHLDAAGHISGDEAALSRLISLARTAGRWFATAALIVSVGLGVGGTLFFSLSPVTGVDWMGPWVAFCVLGAANLYLLFVWALLEGCNQVTTVYGWRLLQSFLISTAIWLSLTAGLGLWAIPIASAVSFGAATTVIWTRYRHFMASLLRPASGPGIDWRADLWPMQWRIGVSYLTGYFSHNLFTPLTFHYAGPVAAGRLGMTFQLVWVVGSLAALWPSTRAPQFGMLIARRQFDALDRLFRRVFVMSEIVLVGGAAAAWLVVVLIHALELPLAARFLPPAATGILMLGAIGTGFGAPFSVYLRAHKREPFMALSVVSGLLTGLAAWVLAARGGVFGVVWAYTAVALLVTLPAGIVIFLRCRAEWHRPRGTTLAPRATGESVS